MVATKSFTCTVLFKCGDDQLFGYKAVLLVLCCLLFHANNWNVP